MLTLRRLEIFVRVADTGHVTTAAEQVGLTQAAVSMALAQLEEYHGGALFERRGRSLVLNEKGRLILPPAREILSQVKELRRMLDTSWDEPVGQLRIGASTTIGNYLLPLLMGEFTRRYPQAEVQLHVGNTEMIARDVVAGELDIGLIEGPCHAPELECTFWRKDELLVVCAPQHLWTEMEMVGRDELLAETWIIREPGSGTREVFETAMGLGATELEHRLELGHTEAIKKAVQAGLGVSCLSGLALEIELELGRVAEVSTDLALQRELSIITSRNREQGALVRACLEMLEEGP
jgi:DNA-binding transcriptional LysR family regulator